MNPEDMGRFSGPALLILMSLAGAPRHGYAIMEDIPPSPAYTSAREPSMELSHGWRNKD